MLGGCGRCHDLGEGSLVIPCCVILLLCRLSLETEVAAESSPFNVKGQVSERSEVKSRGLYHSYRVFFWRFMSESWT